MGIGQSVHQPKEEKIVTLYFRYRLLAVPYDSTFLSEISETAPDFLSRQHRVIQADKFKIFLYTQKETAIGTIQDYAGDAIFEVRIPQERLQKVTTRPYASFSGSVYQLKPKEVIPDSEFAIMAMEFCTGVLKGQRKIQPFGIVSSASPAVTSRR